MDLERILAEVAASQLSVEKAAERIRRMYTRCTPGPGLGQTSLRGALLFAAIGSVTAGVGVWFAVQSYQFASASLRTEGTVISLVRSNSGTSAPVVRYEAGGQAFEFQSRVYSQPLAYSVGDKVSVLYRPDQPGTGQIDSFLERWFVPLMLGGLGGAFAAVGSAIICARVRRR